jgi:putative endonuclease
MGEACLETPPIGVRNKRLGRRGERCASDYLSRLQYKILENNWRCSFGEADIIALDDSELVFVEVKTRATLDQGFPSEAVDRNKRVKYEKIALAYLANNDINDVSVRFDVIAVVPVDSDRAMLRHHVNAYGVAE